MKQSAKRVCVHTHTFLSLYDKEIEVYTTTCLTDVKMVGLQIFFVFLYILSKMSIRNT